MIQYRFAPPNSGRRPLSLHGARQIDADDPGPVSPRKRSEFYFSALKDNYSFQV